MTHSTTQDAARSHVLAWSTQCANMPATVEDETADVDEPPDAQVPISPMSSMFKRNPIRRGTLDNNTSLLTRALHSPSEDEDPEARPGMSFFARRRSMASNISLASTADLTSDTGLTSPSRANTPSPPIPEMRYLQLNDEPRKFALQQAPTIRPQEPAKEAPKKRCIQFACGAKPKPAEPIQAQPMVKAPSAQEPQRRTCIKFACPVPQRPASTQNTPPQRLEMAAAMLQPPSLKESSPATVRKTRSRSPRPALAPRAAADTKSPTTKRYITANDNDLQNESSHFHEFASDIPREDDWIRQAFASHGRRITIDDTLQKENAIRKLAAEAEEEAEQEEEDMETAMGDDDDEDLDNDVDDQDDEDEEQEEEDEDDDDEDEDDNSDGYKTDEETGFADSDEEEEEDEDLRLWTPGRSTIQNIDTTPVARRLSMTEQLSDSSIVSRNSLRVRRGKTQRMKIRPGTPELPDSTDFVCGTLDEDRPMEDAYISCLAARRREKLQLIPQDIDPSFPASDPEDEGDEEIYNPVHHSSDDEMFLHGKMDDLHHEQDRSRRRKKSEHTSPKRFRSPPPMKRRASPAPKARVRSPRRLFDGPSPRRLRSPPPPQMLRSPPASPRNAQGAIAFKTLASRPGLTVTKSLPRPPSMFPHMAKGRRSKASAHAANDIHVRGAIDIVKGLERKRQRRKEKFYQKYCNRARKGQIPERKPQRGLGYERMKELGLLMAGKIDQGNYVLSV
ncbi:uncharacterized protein CTRU02_213014 [Colletotrichum truncatum]|uniref:Uncharacterized protein n=1 Tax=Colletotrichum truncatum TaxID=5467 RepID=A0ACC3YK19_COLTU|nr:uncharacterized protein CTRU02_03333 [Colletotrichum truncatum]KAF6797302.1 hypothetical protein CTRU02_03333 [Colletotrichum truncatum]